MAPMAPIKPRLQHTPLLRMHFDDVDHEATDIALSALDSGRCLKRAVDHVVTYLYTPYGLHEIPRVRSVTVILRPMDGVAYTTGIRLDDLHKEIHVSLNYIQQVAQNSPPRIHSEMAGVITHEMVHCFQNNCKGTAPGGLIEGIADYVRLKAGLAPPHWKRTSENLGNKWDEGYQKTAWFLDWLEQRRGPGTVSHMNAIMRTEKYDEKQFWQGIFGESVDKLWARYKAAYAEDEHGFEGECELPGRISTSSSEPVLVDLEQEEKEEAEGEMKKPKEFVA